MAQQVKSPPAIKETQEVQVQSLGQEDPLEEEMTAHSSVLAWKIPWTEESGGLQSPKSWTQLSNSQQQWFHNVTLSERDQILKICCLSIYMNNNKRQNSCVDKKKKSNQWLPLEVLLWWLHFWGDRNILCLNMHSSELTDWHLRSEHFIVCEKQLSFCLFF